MSSKDVQTPRASQPLFCEKQCQKVTTTKMFKQNSSCKHSIDLISEGKKMTRPEIFLCLRENQVPQGKPKSRVGMDQQYLVGARGIKWKNQDHAFNLQLQKPVYT